MTVIDRHAGHDDDVADDSDVQRSVSVDSFAVQRSVAIDDFEVTPDPEPPATQSPVTGVTETAAEASPKEMADKIYPHIERRLRRSLQLERERKGALTDALWSAGGR